MIELFLGLIVACFAISLAVIVLWVIIGVPVALIGSIISERDRVISDRRKRHAATWINMWFGADAGPDYYALAAAKLAQRQRH